MNDYYAGLTEGVVTEFLDGAVRISREKNIIYEKFHLCLHRLFYGSGAWHQRYHCTESGCRF